MKVVCLTIVSGLTVAAAGAIFAASQTPYQAERIIATQSMLTCGAGYYNEGYFMLAIVCIVAACVMTVVVLDYLKNAARDGRP